MMPESDTARCPIRSLLRGFRVEDGVVVAQWIPQGQPLSLEGLIESTSGIIDVAGS